MPSQCGATTERMTRGPKDPGSIPARVVFPLGKEIIGTAGWSSWLGMLIGPSFHHYSPMGAPQSTLL